MENKIKRLFETKQNHILSVYFTAGHPGLDDTVTIIKELENNGVDMIEIGMPFSDPLADGPVIQKSSQTALQNGMSLKTLFKQLETIQNQVRIPLLLMGYLNPVLQYGMQRFCEKANAVDISGIIIPDLPVYEYSSTYKKYFLENNLNNVLLITPETSEERIHEINTVGSGFIYMVSTSSTTGVRKGIIEKQEAYFKRIQAMNLTTPTMIGFGISNKETFDKACQYANGAIIGSAFITALNESHDISKTVKQFAQKIRGQ
jgi:tryptophan synthase alpha chain